MEIGPGREYYDPAQKSEYNEQQLMAGIVGCILLIVNQTMWFVYSSGFIDQELYMVYSLSVGSLVGILGYALISLGFLTLYQSSQHPILAINTIFFFIVTGFVVVQNIFLYELALYSISLYLWTGLFLVGGIAFLVIRFQIISEELFTITGIVYLVAGVVYLLVYISIIEFITIILVWVFTALSFFLIYSRYSR